MSICANISELVRELRSAAGTVLSIVGSRLEADSRAQAEYGPQWLTEFEEQRDVAEPPFEPLSKCADLSCGCQDDARYQSSAADTAADPSPADANTVPRGVGDEGPGPDSVIPQTVGPGHPTDPTEVSAPSVGVNTVCGICFGRSGQCDCTARLFGQPVLEDDLAAHIMGDFVSGQEVDPLTATLIDALSSRIASALLTDFNITRK